MLRQQIITQKNSLIMKTTIETLSTERKTIKGHKVVIVKKKRTINTSNSKGSGSIYFEISINGKQVGSNDIGERQLNFILDNVDKYAQI